MSSKLVAWPEGVTRRVLTETDSTNAEAARMAPQQLAPAWILALRQSQGRGRRGRAWVDQGGNFAASLLMRPAGAPDTWAQLSFVAALALRDALTRLTARGELLTLKWPNDVLMNGAKVAGILLETAANESLIIGIGVNLYSAPDRADLDTEAVAPTSVLDATGMRLEPTDLLDALAPEFDRWRALYDAQGFAPIRAAFLADVTRLGTVVTARTGREEITGTFRDIDATGAIVLETARGTQHLPAADIYF